LAREAGVTGLFWTGLALGMAVPLSARALNPIFRVSDRHFRARLPPLAPAFANAMRG
jgi:hypothetical protein